MKPPVVGFAGMTHLGLVSASAVAARGFEVVCFDADRVLIDRVTRQDWPVLEPGLDELVRGNGARQRFTGAPGDLGACEVVYVAPDVPTDDQGQSDVSGLTALIREVAAAMNPAAVMVVLSQVPPGYTRALGVLPPGRLYCQVETLVFGQAVERALKPERIIVGCADPGAPLDVRFRAVLEAFGCPILPMRYESAELAKISINCCLVASVTVANTASIVQAWLHNSRHRRDWAVRTIRRAVLDRNPDAILAIWGLAYKANTHSVKNSPSLAILSQLDRARLRVHDPVVPTEIIARPEVEGYADPIKAAVGADALMILTPWPEYSAVAPTRLASALRGKTVVDPYGVLDGKKVRAAGLSYYTLGQLPIAVT